MQTDFNTHFTSIQQLFSDHGIKNITMDDIAHCLHISKKTIYKHYSCKDELVSDVFLHDYYQFKAALQALEGEDTDAISKTIRLYHLVFWKATSVKSYVFFDLEKYYPDLLNEITDLHRDSIRKTFTGTLTEGKVHQIFKDEINPHSVARIFTYLFESYVTELMLEPKEADPLCWVDVFDYHFNSICNLIGLLKWENLKNQNSVDKLMKSSM